MKAFDLFLLFLASCATEISEDSGKVSQDDDPEFICDHPDSPYEARIQAEYPDNNYLKVELVLEQEEKFWLGELKPPNGRNTMWHMSMQLLNFDCRSPYIWNFIPQD